MQQRLRILALSITVINMLPTPSYDNNCPFIQECLKLNMYSQQESFEVECSADASWRPLPAHGGNVMPDCIRKQRFLT